MSTPARSFRLLRVERHASVYRCHVQFGASRVLVNALLDLHAQLTRGSEDESAGASRSVDQPIDDRQCERRSLSGAGLRESHDVAAVEHERDCLRLDRSRRHVSRVAHRLEDDRGETELIESLLLALRRLLYFNCLGNHDSHCCAPGPLTRDHPGTGVCIYAPAGRGPDRLVFAELGSADTRGVAARARQLAVTRHPSLPRPSWRLTGAFSGNPCRGVHLNLTHCGT